LHAPPGSATSTPSISCEPLLGAAEAGFFPGIIFYLTLWFPTEYRARIVGYFTAAIRLSTVIGAPISGLLLFFHGGLGLAGWQWLFIIEAVPAIILAGVVFFYLTDRLTDRPTDAAWLAADERNWLSETLLAERRRREAVRRYTIVEALCNRRVIGLSLVYFGAVARPQHIPDHAGPGRAICCRTYRHGLVGPPVRSRGGAPLPHRDSALHCRRRHCVIDRAR
jgi:MFS family permease